MNEKEFRKLLKKDRYQVFLFISKIPVPFNFALHAWFVTNEKGKINRWEVWQSKNNCKTSWGHIHMNLLKPLKGIDIFTFFRKIKWKSALVAKIEGKKGSIAQKMINTIKNSKKDYTYLNKYHFFPGPNSNTYIQWILNRFPKSGLRLPWNAFGKNYY